MSFLDRIDSVAKRIERFVSGNAPSDPLYVSNRTLGQKFRVALLLGAPALAIGTLIFLALGSYFDPPPSPAKVVSVKEATGEITAKVLPSVEKDFAESSGDVDVVEATVGLNHTLSGKLRNNTDHLVRVADVVFDVTDQDGSQLGGIAVRVENIAAKSIATFKVNVEQQSARTALVREVHSR